MAFTKMLWLLNVPTQIGSWDYWSSVSGVVLGIPDFMDFKKENNKIAYYGLAVMASYNPRYPDACFIMMSPDADAVSYRIVQYGSQSQVYPYNSTITDVNGITWYVNAFRIYNQIDIENPNIFTKSCYINKLTDQYPDDAAGRAKAISDMLGKIYAVPFIRNDYQYRQVYSFDFSTLADAQKTIRKAVGIFLYMNLSLYTSNSRYQAFSDNADSIISNILTLIGTNKFVLIDDIEIDNDYVTCYLYINHDNTELNTKQLQNVTDITNYGYRKFTFGSVSPADVLGYNSASVRIDALGTISAARGTSVSSLSTFTVGLQVWESNSYIHVRTTNLGIDL